MGTCMTNTVNEDDEHESINESNNQVEPTQQPTAEFTTHQQYLNEMNIQFDLSAFKNDNIPECNEHDNDSVANCGAIKRITGALQYYALFDLENDRKHQDIFTHFVQYVYTILLDDKTHIVQKHGHQTQQIKTLLMKENNLGDCKVSQCNLTARHHRVENQSNDNKGIIDPIVIFYKDIMDAIHFYVFHLYECGLRVSKTDEYDDNKHESKTDNEYYDAELARITRIIKERQINTTHFDRFKVSNKFNIIVDNIITKAEQQTGGEQTFMDEMINYLSKNGVANKTIKILVGVLDIEEY
eukprot:359364_1